MLCLIRERVDLNRDEPLYIYSSYPFFGLLRMLNETIQVKHHIERYTRESSVSGVFIGM